MPDWPLKVETVSTLPSGMQESLNPFFAQKKKKKKREGLLIMTCVASGFIFLSCSTFLNLCNLDSHEIMIVLQNWAKGKGRSIYPRPLRFLTKQLKSKRGYYIPLRFNYLNSTKINICQTNGFIPKANMIQNWKLILIIYLLNHFIKL